MFIHFKHTKNYFHYRNSESKKKGRLCFAFPVFSRAEKIETEAVFRAVLSWRRRDWYCLYSEGVAAKRLKESDLVRDSTQKAVFPTDTK